MGLVRAICFLTLVVALEPTALAARDESGVTDHPLVSRYPGSVIEGQRRFDYDEYGLAVGLDKNNKAQLQRFSGKATSTIYHLEGDQSTIQVMRNHEEALQKAGMKILFSCSNKSCGSGLPVTVFRGTTRESLYRSMRYDSMHAGNADIGYLSATGTFNGAPVAVGVYVGRLRVAKRTDIGVDIIESEPMKRGLITVSAESLRKDIEAQGRAVLDGVFFNTDEASLEARSQAALQVIAEYLKKNSSAYFVVGHTDTDGTYDHNVALSKRRAQAVVDELTRSHGVAKDRLTAVGVGPVAPAQTNATDNGRAQNRRVELVLQVKTP